MRAALREMVAEARRLLRELTSVVRKELASIAIVVSACGYVISQLMIEVYCRKLGISAADLGLSTTDRIWQAVVLVGFWTSLALVMGLVYLVSYVFGSWGWPRARPSVRWPLMLALVGLTILTLIGPFKGRPWTIASIWPFAVYGFVFSWPQKREPKVEVWKWLKLLLAPLVLVGVVYGGTRYALSTARIQESGLRVSSFNPLVAIGNSDGWIDREDGTSLCVLRVATDVLIEGPGNVVVDHNPRPFHVASCLAGLVKQPIGKPASLEHLTVTIESFIVESNAQGARWLKVKFSIANLSATNSDPLDFKLVCSRAGRFGEVRPGSKFADGSVLGPSVSLTTEVDLLKPEGSDVCSSPAYVLLVGAPDARWEVPPGALRALSP